MKIIRLLVLSALVALMALGLCAEAEGLLLPDSLEVVGEEAFYGAEALDEVTLPDGVRRVESLAFAQSSLTRIGLPESVEYIAPDAFDGCQGLTAWGAAYSYAQTYCEEHEIPFECDYTDLSLFTFTFTGDTTATLTGYTGSDPEVTIPPMADETHTITAIGNNAFKGKTGVTAVRMPDTVTKIGSSAFNGCAGLTTIRLPRDLNTLEDRAFNNCANLVDIEFNDKLQYISTYAFSNCPSLIDADLPDSVLEMRFAAFMNDTALTSFHYPLNMQKGEHNGAQFSIFSGCVNLKSVVIQEGVTRIANDLFSYHTALTSVTLPSTLERVSVNCFRGCTGLTEINIPDTVYIIGNSAFRGCTGLTTVRLPRDLETLEGSAFQGCTNLVDIEFNEKLKYIQTYAFADCPLLTDADLPDSVLEMRYAAFMNDTALTSFHYPLNLQQGESNGVQFSIFSGCVNLKSVEIPEGVTKLAREIFAYHVSLTDVTLPSTLTSIDAGAFMGCTGLTEIDIPDGVTVIGDSAFKGCTGFTTIHLPRELDTLNGSAFQGCSNVTDFEFNDKLRIINVQVFDGCSSLVEADLPDSVERIRYAAFRNCTSLTSFHYPKSLQQGESNQVVFCIFYNCPNLTSVTIPEGVTKVAKQIFTHHAGLTSVTLPSTLTTIEAGAFLGCTGLPSDPMLYVRPKVTSIANDAFNGCTNLKIESEYGAYVVDYCQSHSIPYYYLSMIGKSVPTGEIWQHYTYTLRGSILSTDELTDVRATVYDLNGGLVKEVTATPGATSYKLQTSMSGQLDLGELALGSYRLVVEGGTALTHETFVNTTFSVVEAPLMVDFSECEVSGIVLRNGPLNMSGTMRANYPMDLVDVTVFDAAGNMAKHADSTLGTGIDYCYMEGFVNKLGTFSEPGNYRVRIEVTGHGETVVVYDSYASCNKTYDPSMRNPDPLFSSPLSGSYSYGKQAYWSALFAKDAYGGNRGKEIAEACYFNYDPEESPRGSLDTIRSVMMWKDVDNQNGTYTRVYGIGVEGTVFDELSQWNSNLKFIDSTVFHQGFEESAQVVLNDFLAYRSKIETDHPKNAEDNYTADKLWLSGHSRGAAVVNILGGYMLPNQGYSASQLYCYCFACPNVKKGSVSGKNYIQVYDFKGDVVPRVPLSDWGYGKYGHIHRYGEENNYDPGSAGAHNTLIVRGEETDMFIGGVLAILPLDVVVGECSQYLAANTVSDIAGLLRGYIESVQEHSPELDKFLQHEAKELFYAALSKYDPNVKSRADYIGLAKQTHKITTYMEWMEESCPAGSSIYLDD